MEALDKLEKFYALCRPDEGRPGPIAVPALIGAGRVRDPRILCLEFKLGAELFTCGDEFDDWAIVGDAEPGRTCDVWTALEGDPVELLEHVCSIALTPRARDRELNAVLAGTAVAGPRTVDDLVDLWGPSGSDEIDPELFEAAASRIGLDEIASQAESASHDGAGSAPVFPDATGVDDAVLHGVGADAAPDRVSDESGVALPARPAEGDDLVVGEDSVAAASDGIDSRGARAAPGASDELVVDGEAALDGPGDGLLDGPGIPVRAGHDDPSGSLDALSERESREPLPGVSTPITHPDGDSDPVLGAVSSAPRS